MRSSGIAGDMLRGNIWAKSVYTVLYTDYLTGAGFPIKSEGTKQMKELDRLSVFISLILRHRPEEANVVLDERGWADVEELLDGIRGTGREIDRGILEEIVATDKKQRYSFSRDGRLIRANQGHSVPVDVELEEAEPPEFLYHGTAAVFLDGIRKEGLKPMSRLYVHLSGDAESARKIGQRHGSPVVLRIRSGDMWRADYRFYLSVNGVWLTGSVPTEYLQEENGEI